ncbi:MAG: UvrD-helicase domain-containing protein [Bacillota bacterium]
MDLSVLNDKQREAVLHTEGPLLILAGAGSGKTRVLTHRIAYMIDHLGVHPGQILAITFTNKAAKEMKDRVEDLLGRYTDVWVSTFHSACVRILRYDIDKIGYTRDFVIYDSSDQQTLIKQCLKELNIDDKQYPPSYIQSKIGQAKDQMQTPKKYYDFIGNDTHLIPAAQVYELYQKKLKKNNALDFDDLIFKTVELFRDHQEVLSYYQSKFQYILVDEYQDTNKSQYSLIRMLAAKHRNLCVVGDDDQCIPEGMQIHTPLGNKNIEALTEEQQIICASGHSNVMIGAIEKTMKKAYKGLLVKIKTKAGKEIKGTPNHIGFANINPQPGIYYVYLMYKKGYGYRIGQTQGVRSRKGEIVNGLAVRLNQEHADKMWILSVCENKEEAIYLEQFLSTKYGIPTTVFHANGRNMAMSQTYIDRMFRELDTEKAVVQLMNDLIVFEEYPHHIPNAVIRGGSTRRVINMNAFGGRKTGNDCGWHSHRICLNTSGEQLKSDLSHEFPVRSGQRNTWRIETERKEYDEAVAYVKKIQQYEETLEIVNKARLTEEKSFYYMPLAHMKPTMSVPILENGRIVEDIIETVEYEEYEGWVYDLSIPTYRQYICGGVVVHNSIYGWRGADIRNILSFEDDFPNAMVVKLEQNYRSIQNVLDAANTVIKNNKGRKSKKLWTANKEGDKIGYYRAMNEHDEGLFITNQIVSMVETEGRNYAEFAILYRTNAQSRVIEEMLLKANIPYKIIGGHKFYDRKEIKDIIAYLRLIQNPVDDISLKRVLNVPKRGIGDRTIDRMEEYARQTGDSLFGVLLNDDAIQEFSKKVVTGIRDFVLLISKYGQQKEEISVTQLIRNVLDESGYLKALENENTIEATTRIENLQEFISVAMEFERNSEVATLEEFLANISLMSDIDNMEEEENAVVLMTLHSAKGLEFPVVFMAGMEEGIFPSSRSIIEDEDVEEERRICYVGITRAREKLFLTHALIRTLYGRTMYNGVSRFIDEIDEHLLDRDKEEVKKAERQALAPAPGIYRGVPLKEAARPMEVKDTASIRPGAKVAHDKFGKGTVISVKGSGDTAELTIAFDSAGIKKLVFGYAPIKIMG